MTMMATARQVMTKTMMATDVDDSDRYAHWWVCGKCAHDDCDGATGEGRRATKLTTMAMEQRDTMTMTMVTDVGVVDDDYDADNTSWTMSDEGDNHQG